MRRDNAELNAIRSLIPSNHEKKFLVDKKGALSPEETLCRELSDLVRPRKVVEILQFANNIEERFNNAHDFLSLFKTCINQMVECSFLRDFWGLMLLVSNHFSEESIYNFNFSSILKLSNIKNRDPGLPNLFEYLVQYLQVSETHTREKLDVSVKWIN